MTVRGHIENGAVVIDGDVTLPEGTRVTVEVDADPEWEAFRKTLHPKLQPWVGIFRQSNHSGERDLEQEYNDHLVEKYLR